MSARRPSPAAPAAILLCLSALGWLALRPAMAELPTPVAVAALAAAVVAAQWATLTVDHNGDALDVTLGGVVIVVGALTVGPVTTLVVQMLVGGTAFWLRWRTPLHKVLWNLLAWSVEVWAGATVLANLAGPSPDGGDPVTWLAIAVALVAGDLASYAAILLTLRMVSGPLRPAVLRRIATGAAFSIVISGVFAVLAVAALTVNPVLLVPVAVATGVLWVNNRGRHHVAARFRALQGLYEFMSDLPPGDDQDPLLASILAGAKTITGAEEVTLLLMVDRRAERLELIDGALHREDADATMVRRLYEDLRHGMVVAPGDAAPDADLTGATSGPMLIQRFSRDEVRGVLVLRGRRLDMPVFGAADMELASAVVDHSAQALVTSRLLARLRDNSRRMQRLALYDAETNLLNLSGLLDEVDRISNTTLVMLHLEELDEIEAGFGNQATRRLLDTTAQRLLRFVNAHGGQLARVGSSRFAVLLPTLTDLVEAQSIIRMMRATVQAPHPNGLNLRIRVPVSAMTVTSETSVAEMIRAATSALIHHARPGGPIAWHDPTIDAQAAERLLLAGDLTEALDSGGLSVAYQPKMELATGRILGVEALARWVHPERGFISPAVFIDIAERTGLIQTLTMHITRMAMEQTARWRASGLDIGVAVNLSTAVVDDPGLARGLVHLLSRYDMPPDALTVEITESQMMEDLCGGGGALALLDEAGVLISVDDFGTGYSSLSQLRRLPVDELKIDRSFITALARDTDSQAIATAIITMARQMQLKVVAEGIEDEGTLGMLSDMGCDIVQGYHIARPMPAADLPAFLRDHREVARSVATPTVLPFRRTGAAG